MKTLWWVLCLLAVAGARIRVDAFVQTIHELPRTTTAARREPQQPAFRSVPRSTSQLRAAVSKSSSSVGRFLFRHRSLSKGITATQAQAGVETVQILLDPRRKNLLKQELSGQFPLLPAPIIDVCIDSAAEGLSIVTPRDWKRAIRPGGFTHMRATIKMKIVKHMMAQPAIKNISLLSSKDKVRLLNAVVDILLDLVESQQVLQAPEDKLNALSKQQDTILRTMSPWKRTIYRIRTHPVRSLLLLAVVGGLLYRGREARVVEAVQPWVQKSVKAVRPYIQEAFRFIGLCGGTVVGWLIELSTALGRMGGLASRGVKKFL